MPMLSVRDLTVSYGRLEAVRGVSFSVEAGQIVALIGSNGAGKSTTLKALIGLVPPASGQILLDGRDITRAAPAARVHAGIALSPEGRRLFGRMSVQDNLLAGAHGVGSRAVVRRMLDDIYALFPQVRERRSQLAGSLSGGEQQMVAIGRALMANPRLLMLDEPSLGIAPKIVAEIAGAIERINREKNMAIVLVEQNARLALRLSHRAYALEHGEIIRSGKGAELLADPFVQKAYLGV
ncbi:ABC transporter ATP-binding protein [Pollutimonas bauzanensis]|uniref:Branched-chain amino acid transport system ATP-binding protein n=1 Tax=Pollutimonas bauzanensis TaxID=658167 RepID=A0A1M5PWE3_9BURK|nr:ABC transporter ATP-binding protein [Pollutimonas bauzanensis]SHH06022.1 branched-chain amino acid transport system ATP-binding protein [Pollutimonas bauzanensis]